jgi:hypothetical protein
LRAEGVTEMDDVAGFPGFCAKLESELKPVGIVETCLVRRIALDLVRLKRSALLEAEFITAQLNPPVTEKQGGSMDAALDGLLYGQVVVTDPGLPARLSAASADTLANTFARYETALENRLFRCLNQLERVQRLRQGENIPAPATVDVAVHADGQPLASFGNPPQLQEETAP